MDTKAAPSTPFDDSLKLIDEEFKNLKMMARNTFGNKPIGYRFHEAAFIQTDTSGLVQQHFNVDPSNLAEFASLVPIFDEFKVNGGSAQINLFGPMLQTSASLTCVFAVAYDPTDITAVTSVPNMMENAQSKAFSAPLVSQTTVGGAVTQTPTSTYTPMHTFKYVVPRGTLIVNSAIIGDGSWQNMASGASYVPYGYVKFYGSPFRMTGAATITTIAYWLHVYEAELRIRD